ncbi:MAG TPA: hypothetical protein VMV81_03315 [Phycisphaerae bacterium]|nr:hypothetical protein [Phycisphaerae bacterium]
MRLTVSSIAAVLLALTGCRPTSGPVPADTTAAIAHPSSLDNAHDLRLFGQGGALQDISFEQKAAVNILQHTTSSEGADFDPAIDPAARQLAFSSTRHSRFSHIYTKSVDGSAITQLTDGRANEAQPAFSPDGRRIAFASDRSGNWDIWCMDVSGRNIMQLTTSPMAELHPSWSPDGKRLVYCKLNPRDAGGELWIVDTENPGAKRLIGEGLFPAWSPKGDKIAFQRARQRGSRWFSIWTISLDDDEPGPPTEVVGSSEAAYIAPCWSGDGTQLAFACIIPTAPESPISQNHQPAAARSDIAMVDCDGRGMIRLTNGRGENYSPWWSSDDRIFFSARHEGSETIWSVKPFRPSVTPVLPPPPPMSRHAASARDEDSEP